MSSHPRPDDSKARSTELRKRSFRLCFVVLAALSLLNCELIAASLGPAAQTNEESPQAVATLTWWIVAQDWALSLLPIWLLARAASRWVARSLEAPIDSIVERCDHYRRGQREPATGPRPNAGALTRAAEAVDDLLAHFDRLEQQQHRCLTDAAHELRTPLTAQAVVAENALAKRGDLAELREAVGSMLEEAQHMQRLIENLLLMCRAGTSRAVTAEEKRLIEPQDLSELARSSAHTLQVLAEEKRQTIAIRSAGPVWAKVDPTMARQAMLNVVHNAIQHCQDGAHIEVETAVRGGGHAVMAVTDNGPGIAHADQTRVFESFFRGTGSSRQLRAGLGLGLGIARATMASQGGSIRLISQPGKGCRFELLLPLAEARMPSTEAPPTLGHRSAVRRWQEPVAVEPAPTH